VDKLSSSLLFSVSGFASANRNVSLMGTPEEMMRNPIQLVAAIRTLAVLANVAILAVERFAAFSKPEMPKLCFAGTSRHTRRWQHHLGGHLDGYRCRQAISTLRCSDAGYSGTGYPVPTQRGDMRVG
jgi:hypothetical protein